MKNLGQLAERFPENADACLVHISGPEVKLLASVCFDWICIVSQSKRLSSSTFSNGTDHKQGSKINLVICLLFQ